MLGFSQALTNVSVPRDASEAVELAIWAHMELVAIHPFQEGNGRTARLLMNVFIMRHVTSPSRPLDIPTHMRDRHIRCVQDARQSRPEGFIAMVVDLLETLAEG